MALHEAAQPAFREYANQVVVNARSLADELLARGFELGMGGTDNHLILIDLTGKNVPGKPLAKALDRAGIVTNYNTVPFDPRKPFNPSGLRIGTPAVTSRGMGPAEMQTIAGLIDEVTRSVSTDDETIIKRVAGQVRELAGGFPAPGITV